jgi:hypothetical protein
MRKSLFVSAFLLLGGTGVSQAQISAAKSVLEADNAASDFSATSAARVRLPDFLAVADSFAQPRADASPVFSIANLSTTLLAEPASAKPPAPSPKPRFVYGGRDDYRWELGLAFAWLRFRSSVFNSNEFGVKASVAYYLNEWLGAEGNFTGAFGGGVGAGGHDAKIALYGGGPKVAWRQHRWEPWLHAIFGGGHEGPQTVFGARNSFAMHLGGGADYRGNPHLSYRLEGDYVHTSFFHQTQNSFQLAAGAVIHF